MQDLNLYWENCLNIIKQEIEDISFNTWFKDLKAISLNENELVLQAVDEFFKDTIILRHSNLLNKVSSQVLKKDITVKIVLENEINLEDKQNNNKTVNKNNKQTNDQNLNPNYIFKKFVVGESNRMAHAASVAVAENPGKAYNPLFLYGDVGLGKTHLMHAVAHYILEQTPSSKVLYASCEKFTNELIASIKEQKNKEFREKYRKIDVLLIDDIQFITDKTQTQEEFFHTFNDLKDSGKQIIISSDRPPNEIKTLTERLRSRFAGGLIADIKMPNFETRTAILEKKAESLQVNLPEEVSQFIAQAVKSNIRELEGALTRVIAYSDLTNSKLSVELAKEALKDIVQDTNEKITITYIQEIVANHYGIKLEEIKSKKRNQPIADARQVAMYLSRQILNDPLANIGKQFGRDHSTIIHAIDKIENKIKTNNDFQNLIEELTTKIAKK